MAFSSPKWSDSSFHPKEIVTPKFIAMCIFPFVLLQFPAIILPDMWIYILGTMKIEQLSNWFWRSHKPQTISFKFKWCELDISVVEASHYYSLSFFLSMASYTGISRVKFFRSHRWSWNLPCADCEVYCLCKERADAWELAICISTKTHKLLFNVSKLFPQLKVKIAMLSLKNYIR